MEQGYGAPYIKVYTSLGEVTSRVTDFTYKYSQEQDDLCQIRIESGDPNLPDYPEFQEGVILKITWGYLGEKKKKSREVIIRNVKAAFSQTIISLDLLCTDRVSRIKFTSSKKVHNNATLKSMANEIALRNGCGLNMDGGGNGDSVTATNVRQTAYLGKDGNYKEAIDNVLVAKTLTYRIFDTLPQANKSDFTILKEAAENDPNGPFEVTGRDNILSINPINTKQNPIRNYTWAGGNGELLQFTPESKNFPRSQGAMQISTTGFNPKNKTAFDTQHNEFTNGTSKIGVVTDYSPRFTSSGLASDNKGVPPADVIVGPDKKLRVKKVPAKSSGNSNTPNADKPQTKIQPDIRTLTSTRKAPNNAEQLPGDDFQLNSADVFGDINVTKKDNGLLAFGTLNTESIAYKNSLGNFTTAVSTTAVIKPIVLLRAIDYNQHVPTEDHSADEANKGANKQIQNGLDKNPATAKVIGDCDLESGKVLTFFNASKKHSGNYYIKECTHRIVPNTDYYIDLTMSKNAVGRTGSESPITLAVNRFDSTSPADVTTDINNQLGPDEINNKTNLTAVNANQSIIKSPGIF